MKKWATITFLASFLIASSLLLDACKKADAEPYKPTAVDFEIPAGFPAAQYNLAANPLTKEGIALGKKLFYDGKLSKDGNFPCASCHQPFAAFATFDHDLSHGFNNSFTTRNAPALFNLAWYKEFHHDGGINNLEVQPLAPLTATNEMAETVDGVVTKLKNDNDYRQLFKKAFGDDEINSQRMLKAITQFMVTMVSANSKYDKVKRGEAAFGFYEDRGYVLFKAKCASCHAEPLFTDLSYRNNGLTANDFLKDYGRMRITGNKSDSLKFKVPSLRNLQFSFPYMHDGRFSTIEQCVEHYRSGVTKSSTLDPALANNGIPLSTVELVDIVAFLRTLTDSSFINNPQFLQQ